MKATGSTTLWNTAPKAYTATALSQRSVLFLKNQKFWIVTDYLVPNDPSVENTYHQNWHLYPGANMSSDGNKAVRSNYTNEPNVLIVPAAPEDIDTLEYVDTYYSEAAGQLQDGKKARYGKVQTGNALFGTVLFPMDTGEDYTVTTSAVSGTANASYANAFSFTVKNNQTGAVQTYYYYHLNDPSMKQAVTVGNYTTDAQTLLVQEDAAGNYVSAFLMHGSYLRNADTNRTLFNSPQEVGAIACTIEDGVLALASSELQKSQLNGMSFYAGAAAAATFNGSPAAGTAENGLITFSGLTDDPEEEPTAGRHGDQGYVL